MSEEATERESMAYDVVIVGAGPSGLAAAIRLKQRAAEADAETSQAAEPSAAEFPAKLLF